MWVYRGKDSLSFYLLERGYDVWLGNNRGNIYSRGHKTKNPDGDYFDFSFWEFGKYDLPAMIDKVLSTTKRENLSYIGHSQGTTQMFSALASNHGNLN